MSPCQLFGATGCQGRSKGQEPSAGLGCSGCYLMASIFSERAWPSVRYTKPLQPFYLFSAGFPGLQGAVGLPGALGLSLPSVIEGQPGDPGRPGLDGERGKARKPKDGWHCLVYSPASHPSPCRDTGDRNGLHFAKRVWKGLGTGAPQKAREHYLPWEWALASYQCQGLPQWPLPLPPALIPLLCHPR